MTTLQDMELYNLVEDSFLGNHIIDGAMNINFKDGKTTYREHPMYGEYKELPEYTEAQFRNLIGEIKQAEVEVLLHGDNTTYQNKYMFVIVYESKEDGNLEVSIGTVYNVWEIESARLESGDDILIKRANEIYHQLRGTTPTPELTKVQIKSTCGFTMPDVAHMLVLEDVSFKYDASSLTIDLELERVNWLYSQLVNLKIKNIDYILVDGIKYDYMGMEINTKGILE